MPQIVSIFFKGFRVIVLFRGVEPVTVFPWCDTRKFKEPLYTCDRNGSHDTLPDSFFRKGCKFVYLDTKRFNTFQIQNQKFFKDKKYQPLPIGEFKVMDSTISLWKEFDEYNMLSKKGISGFPKTYQTFQKHKHNNSEKYKNWILLSNNL
jgi:hypothetical protein